MNTTNPTSIAISIVMPLYNKELSVANTLDCVLKQTYSNWNLIIVNDGSTDRSLEIAQGFNDPRISIISKPNGGVSSARNVGIKASKHEHIAFLDADDYWFPEFLEEMVGLITEFPDAGLYGVGYRMTTKDRIDSYVISCQRGVIDNIWEYGMPFWTSAIVVAKKAFNKVGLFDERIKYSEDIDMWCRILLEFDGAMSEKILALYYTDAENNTISKVKPLKDTLFFYIEKYSEARARDVKFRKFFDTYALVRLYPYIRKNRFDPDVRGILKQIDFKQLKLSARLKYTIPILYNFYAKIKRKIVSNR